MIVEFKFADGSVARIEGEDLAGVACIHAVTKGIGDVLTKGTSTFRVLCRDVNDDERWETTGAAFEAAESPAETAVDAPTSSPTPPTEDESPVVVS